MARPAESLSLEEGLSASPQERTSTTGRDAFSAHGRDGFSISGQDGLTNKGQEGALGAGQEDFVAPEAAAPSLVHSPLVMMFPTPLVMSTTQMKTLSIPLISSRERNRF